MSRASCRSRPPAALAVLAVLATPAALAATSWSSKAVPPPSIAMSREQRPMLYDYGIVHLTIFIIFYFFFYFLFLFFLFVVYLFFSIPFCF